MAEKFTVEMKGQGLKDLKQIARSCKEDPQKLLARAFREWVELREDMEDVAIAEREIEEYERTGESYSHEEVMKELGLRKPQRNKRPTRSRPARASSARN